MKICSCKDRHC